MKVEGSHDPDRVRDDEMLILLRQLMIGSILFFVTTMMYTMRLKSTALIITLIALMAACAATRQPNVPERSTSLPHTAKNIVLLIGDGMGITQLSAGTYSNGNTSAFERIKVVGLHKSYASDRLVTDSAAGATAFACGQKTYNGAIAMDPDSVNLPTILEEAEERGLATGLVASSSIVHATPASFIAHNKYRKNYEEIAADFLSTEIDFFVGGGKKFFDNRSTDERNLIAELRENNYDVSTYFDHDLHEASISSDRNFAYLTAYTEPLPHAQGRSYLPLATRLGLDHLSDHDQDGFFLMVEGSQIDWGGHANDLGYVLDEWKEFNSIVDEVLDWADEDGNTLVIITADHETGGLAIQYESKMDSIVGAFTSDYHTGTLIPVFAIGPGAEQFGGIYENTAIYDKMRSAYGW
ncbi:MAG: alkaline phosphatase [Bacteroidota bacterium]